MTIHPCISPVIELDSANLANLAVTIGHRHAIVCGQTTTCVNLTLIERVQHGVGAIFSRRHVEHTCLRAVGCCLPSTTAWVSRAVEGCLTNLRDDRRIDGLGASLRINRRDDVLRHCFLAPEPFTIHAVNRFNNAQFTAGHDSLAGLAIDREVNQQTLIDIVEIERVIGEVLMMPDKLAGLGIDSKSGVCVECVIGVFRIGVLRKKTVDHSWPWIRLTDTGEDQVLIDIIRSGDPGRSAVT